jgi:exo-beta-1,3-glucanase (GH17 family)
MPHHYRGEAVVRSAAVRSAAVNRSAVNRSACPMPHHHHLGAVVRSAAVLAALALFVLVGADDVALRLPASHAVADLVRVGPDGRYCMSFSPFPRGFRPAGVFGTGDGSQGQGEPPFEIVAAVMDQVLASRQVKCVTAFSAQGVGGHIVRAASARGPLPVLLQLFIDLDQDNNRREVDAAISLLAQFPDTIVALICGYEVRLRWDAGLATDRIQACFRALQSNPRVPPTLPIGTMATWPELCDEAYAAVDLCERQWRGGTDGASLLLVSTYAFFENRNPARFPCLPPSAAGEHHVGRLKAVSRVYPQLPVILAEIGWPGPPEPTRDGLADFKCFPFGGSIGSVDAQYQVATDTLRRCRDEHLPCILFEALKEPWKVVAEGFFGPFFGFCDADPPWTCNLPVV